MRLTCAYVYWLSATYASLTGRWPRRRPVLAQPDNQASGAMPRWESSAVTSANSRSWLPSPTATEHRHGSCPSAEGPRVAERPPMPEPKSAALALRCCRGGDLKSYDHAKLVAAWKCPTSCATRTFPSSNSGSLIARVLDEV